MGPMIDCLQARGQLTVGSERYPVEPKITCRSCGSSDVMRTPRKMWERALPLAAYWCRKCGTRFRTARPPESLAPEEAWLVCPVPPERTRNVDIDAAVSSLFFRIVRSAPCVQEAVAAEERIDALLRSVAGSRPLPGI